MRSVLPGEAFQVAGGQIRDESNRPLKAARVDEPVPTSARCLISVPPVKSVDYSKLAREFTNVRSKSNSAGVGGARESNGNENANGDRASSADIITDNLYLITRLSIQTPYRPQFNRSQNWSMDDNFANQLTTYEMYTSVSDPDCRFALNELLIMVEDKQCDRFYILDEAGLTAAVVCGPNTAFWSGTTSLTRAELMRRGIPYVIPLQRSTSAAEAAETLQELRADTLQTSIHASHLEETRCTLFFNSKYSIRGLIEAFINMRMDAKLRIIASQPFPGCLLKMSRAKVSQEMSKSTNTTHWTISFEGYFTISDADRVVQAFTSCNEDLTNVNQYRERSMLTKDFDRVARLAHVQNGQARGDDDEYM